MISVHRQATPAVAQKRGSLLKPRSTSRYLQQLIAPSSKSVDALNSDGLLLDVSFLYPPFMNGNLWSKCEWPYCPFVTSSKLKSIAV